MASMPTNTSFQGIERWRQFALTSIRARYPLFEAPQERSAASSDSTSRSTSSNDPSPTFSNNSGPTSSAISHINELPHEMLHEILGHLDPVDQWAAYHVCNAWKIAVITTIGLKKSVWQESPAYGPVEYAQEITLPVAHKQPSASELQDYERNFLATSRFSAFLYIMTLGTSDDECYTAYYNQAQGLSDNGRSLFHSRYSQNRTPGFYAYAGHDPAQEPRKWLDFSQFDVNGWIQVLFGTRCELRMGKLCIELAPIGPNSKCSDRVLPSSAMPSSVVKLLKTMHISQPRCKTVGIYGLYGPHLKLLKRVHKEDGVRLGDLILSLHEQVDHLKDLWAETMLEAEVSLTEPVLPPGSRRLQELIFDHCAAPPTPTFYILLDNVKLKEWTYYFPQFPQAGHYTRADYLATGLRLSSFNLWDAFLDGKLSELALPPK